MHLQISGNFEITPAIKALAEEKIAQIEKRYNHIGSVHMTLSVEHLTHTAEATIHLDGTEIHASAKDENMYTAIDMLAEKLMGQVTKHKDKLIDSHHQE
jgi:putative sigma-54 modulation protein